MRIARNGFAFSALLFIGSAVQAQIKWDLPTAYSATNFHTENIQQFVADVDKASGGKLKITVHANASLFKANEIKRAVQGGQAQAGEILFNAYENENPLFGLDGIPFLATSYAQAKKLDQASRKSMNDLLAKQGMTMLFSVPWPSQGIYSKKTINAASDLKGVKWRAYSPATSKIAELVGAQPVTVQASELTQALATGVVEAAMTSGATGFDTKMYEHVKNFYDVQAWLPKNAVIVNKKSLDALEPAVRDAVLKAAADAEVRGWKSSQEKSQWYLEQLKAKGMNIHQASPRLQADMKEVGSVMLHDWLKKAGPDGKAIIDAYQKM
jgi:TRAP-type C4-dicarboxylate transport system substrate-binding protein